MTKSILTLLFCASTLATIPTSPTMAQSAAGVRLFALPIDYTVAGQHYYNHHGYAVNIDNYTKLKIFVPDLRSKIVECSRIKDVYSESGYGRRSSCFDGVKYTCQSLYEKSPLANTSVKKYVPNRTVMEWANEYKNQRPGSDFIAINAAFFNLKPLPSRPKSDSVWKPIYQEACGRTIGTYKSGQTNWIYSPHRAPLRKDGVRDVPFGAIHIDVENGSLRLDYGGTITPAYSDLSIPGVFIRRNGVAIQKSNAIVPELTEDKWDSVVGRTAVGINTVTKKMRIVVIQPGQKRYSSPPSGWKMESNGASVDTIRNLVGSSSDYPDVLLLDGSGSSQLASTKLQENGVSDRNLILRGESCDFGTVRACTTHGDSVEYKFIQHLSYRDRDQQDYSRSGQYFIDRPSPAVVMIEY